MRCLSCSPLGENLCEMGQFLILSTSRVNSLALRYVVVFLWVWYPNTSCGLGSWAPLLKLLSVDYNEYFNTLRPRQNGRHFADDTFKCIFLNEDVRILLKISLKFVPKVQINNIPALFQIMAWRWPGDKPLSEPMLVRLPTHICVTRPQWVKS